MRIAAASLVLLAACSPSTPAAAPQKPASVVAKEGDLLTVTLTPEAEKRLGIRTVAIERKKVDRVRSMGGNVQLLPGRLACITAPLAGTISGSPPAAGQTVRKGQRLLTLTPFLSAESRAGFAAARIEAEGTIEVAKVQHAAARIAMERAERLLQDQAGSQRAVEEARALRDSAQAAVKAAETRRDLLAGAVTGTVGPLPLEAPLDGVLQQITVGPGESVTAGTPLFQIADLSRLWIRVPIHVGDWAGVDRSRKTVIEGLSATPATAPPTADPLTATTDHYYEVENPDGVLRPGQKVSVPLPLKGEDDSLTLPHSAILMDIHGGTWVYERIGDSRFTRRRVLVQSVVGNMAVLSRGPAPGAAIVTEGVPELFGTEFGHAR